MLVAAGDLQVELPALVEGVTGSAASSHSFGRDHVERANLLIELRKSFGLLACNTFLPAKSPTRCTDHHYGEEAFVWHATRLRAVLATVGLRLRGRS